jgi:uncharacterized protein (TIGR03000 family)
MWKHLHSTVGVMAITAVSLMLTPDITTARPGSGGSRGGYYGGGSRGGYYGGYRGGYYGGYRGGYYGGYRSGYYYPAYATYGYDGGGSANLSYYYGSPPAYSSDNTDDYPPASSEDDNRSPRDNSFASLVVNLPQADARLTANGNMTRQRGMRREFDTNPINSGKTYTIDFVATWMENGREVKRTRSVTVRPGDHTTVDFTTAENNREVIR